MIRIISQLALHLICIYFLWFLWKEKNKAIQRGTVLTKMGLMSKRKSPRLFYFSIWVDFIIVAALYSVLIAYSISLLY